MSHLVEKNLIVALDQLSEKQALEMAELLRPVGVTWFKVGLELFTLCGPRILEQLKKLDVNIFLDLKLYDIPTTVAQAVQSAKMYDVDFLTIHLSGGLAMLTEAMNAASKGASNLKLLGVTVLTSFSEQDLSFQSQVWAEIATNNGRAKSVESLFLTAKNLGLKGFVCSARDLQSLVLAKAIKESSGLSLVTPGIRLEENNQDDQKAVSSPKFALDHGATHLVVGRPITKAGSSEKIEQAAQKFLSYFS